MRRRFPPSTTVDAKFRSPSERLSKAIVRGTSVLKAEGNEEATEDGNTDAVLLGEQVGGLIIDSDGTADAIADVVGAAVVGVSAGEVDDEPPTFLTRMTERSGSGSVEVVAVGCGVETVVEDATEGVGFKLSVGTDVVSP